MNSPARCPALLRRSRDLAALRHDYPLILVDHGSSRGIESLAAVIDDLLRSIAPRGSAGERIRRRLLRLEGEIRSLVFRKEPGTLHRLWSMAAANLLSQPSLSAEERQSLEDDLETARASLQVQGEAIGCDADTAGRVMRHLWHRADGARLDHTRAQLRELALRLNDLLRSDTLESAESLDPEALARAFGSRSGEWIDFQAMSRTLGTRRPHERLPARRRERIECALRILREEKFFGVDSGSDRYEFAFASCTGALAAFKKRASRMVDLAKAIRIAAIELANCYRDEFHDDFFARFAAASLTADDIRWFPSYFVSLRERDCDAANRANLIEILSSDLPMKLVFQVDHLFQDSKGHPDAPGIDAWRTRLAGMAVNLGSAFTLQTATSNLCPMAARLADGMAAPGPALFCLFSPGEKSHPGLPPYLVAAAAVESRLFPTLVFDPCKGGALAECFSLDGNPQPDRPWPVHPLSYEDGSLQAFDENLPFTAADFMAAAFQPVSRRQSSDEMVPVAQYLQASDEENLGRVPVVLVVDADDRLQRVAVPPAAIEIAQRTARRWHSLQELGGIDKARAHRAADPAPEQPPSQAEQPEPPELDAPVSRDQSWIETPRCTSCNECTNRNNRLFKYNENKQAVIADLHAGTYRDLVEAAESCKVAIIHPGNPWNPAEPGLEELLHRAEPFRQS